MYYIYDTEIHYIAKISLEIALTTIKKFLYGTVCPRSSEPCYIVSYYIKWVTNSWTHSTNIKNENCTFLLRLKCFCFLNASEVCQFNIYTCNILWQTTNKLCNE